MDLPGFTEDSSELSLFPPDSFPYGGLEDARGAAVAAAPLQERNEGNLPAEDQTGQAPG